MKLIGQNLNSSVAQTYAAMQNRDEKALLRLAQEQIDAGAAYLDINTAMCTDELATMLWAVELVQEHCNCGIFVDSTNASVVRALYKALPMQNSVLNSISLTRKSQSELLPIAVEYGAGVVAMPVGSVGIPRNSVQRVEHLEVLIQAISQAGIPQENIYADVAVVAAVADLCAPAHSLEAARTMRKAYPKLHLLAGLSNVSYGLPRRELLNRSYASCLISSGVDCLLLNPLDAELMQELSAAQLLCGQDELCASYIRQNG